MDLTHVILSMTMFVRGGGRGLPNKIYMKEEDEEEKKENVT